MIDRDASRRLLPSRMPRHGAPSDGAGLVAGSRPGPAGTVSWPSHKARRSDLPQPTGRERSAASANVWDGTTDQPLLREAAPRSGSRAAEGRRAGWVVNGRGQGTAAWTATPARVHPPRLTARATAQRQEPTLARCWRPARAAAVPVACRSRMSRPCRRFSRSEPSAQGLRGAPRADDERQDRSAQGNRTGGLRSSALGLTTLSPQGRVNRSAATPR